MASHQKTMITETLVGITLSERQRRLPCLVQFSGSDLGRPFFIESDINVVGRDIRSDILVDEVGVSRKHCQILNTSRGVVIEDMGSANGTYVNNRKIRGPATLKDGCMITLGKAQFKFFSAGNVEQMFYDKVYREKTIDEKTKVFNDKFLATTLKTEMSLAKAYKRDLALIMYDLDHFKKVNDTFGHKFGDEVLKVTAEIVSDVIRKNDVFCRYGGEEFVIILRQTKIETAMKLAERIRKNVSYHVFYPEQKKEAVNHVQTISMGVAKYSTRYKTNGDFIKAVDKRLYEAKRRGRNCVVN